jgi:hypothetical protein
MKKSVLAGCSLLTILVIVAASLALSAASPDRLLRNSPVRATSQPQAPTLIFNRKLVSSTQSYSALGVGTVSAGFVAMDSLVTFKCPSPSCTASAEQSVQIGGSVSGNRFAICTYVDGAEMTQPYCPYLGYVSSDGSFVSGSFTQSASGITPGNHTLQTFLYTDDGGDLGIFNITYRLYTP